MYVINYAGSEGVLPKKLRNRVLRSTLANPSVYLTSKIGFLIKLGSMGIAVV